MADRPSAPATAPVKIRETASSLLVQLTKLTELEASNLPIVRYELEIDDGLAGAYSPVSGDFLQTEYLIEYLQMGRTYRLRYRAENLIGVSEWSESAYMLVAEGPLRPPKPLLVSVNESQITVLLPTT